MGKIEGEPAGGRKEIGDPPEGFQLPGFGFLPVIDMEQGQGIPGPVPPGDRGGHGGIQASAQENNRRWFFFHSVHIIGWLREEL